MDRTNYRKKMDNKKTLLVLFLIFTSNYLFVQCDSSSVKEFYENGDLFCEYSVNLEGQKHGRYMEFYENGSPYIIANYDKGLLNGDFYYYHQNGLIFYHLLYKKNLPWEIIEFSDVEGEKLDFGSFNNGSGYSKKYSKGGELRFSGNYKDGLREGYWKVHSNKGIIDSVLYTNGRKLGLGEIVYTW